jgi:hypothetical protein
MLEKYLLSVHYFMLKFGVARGFLNDPMIRSVRMITVVTDFTNDMMNEVINLYLIYFFMAQVFLPQIFMFRFRYRGRTRVKILVIEKKFYKKHIIYSFLSDFAVLVSKKKNLSAIFSKLNLASSFFKSGMFLSISFRWNFLSFLFNLPLIENIRTISPKVNLVFRFEPLIMINANNLKSKESFRYLLNFLIYFKNFFYKF